MDNPRVDTRIPPCPECGNTKWQRKLTPGRLDTHHEYLRDGEYLSTMIDPGTQWVWQDIWTPEEWWCEECHRVPDEELSEELDELTYELEVRGA